MFNRGDRNSHFLTQKLAKSALDVGPILLHSLSTVELPLTATSPQRSFFLAVGPNIHSCFKLSTRATCLQQSLSSVPKVAVVKRFSFENN